MPVFTAAQHRRHPHSSKTHTHTPHTSTAFMTAVATPTARLSRHALMLVTPSEMIKENGNLRHYCMEHVHGIIGVKVITWPCGKPPRTTKTNAGDPETY